LDAQGHRHVRGEDDRSSFKEYFSALVRLIGSGQDLNQGGFTGAVLAAQTMDLALVEIEGDIPQRHNTWERFRDIS